MNQETKLNKLRRQKINVMLNEEERRILTEKAIKYGFGDCLAEYIRAACIYENIYIEDIEGKREICQYISDYIKVLREILYEQKKILKNLFLSTEDVDKINIQNIQIIEMIDILSNLVVSTLSVNTEKKIQQRMSMIDKHQPDDLFLKKITQEENYIYLIRPSNLQVPNYKYKYFVYLKKYIIDFDLSNIDINAFQKEINLFRDIAMKKKTMLSFYKNRNNLECSIVLGFEDMESADRYAKEIKSTIYYYDGDRYKWAGEQYAYDS